MFNGYNQPMLNPNKHHIKSKGCKLTLICFAFFLSLILPFSTTANEKTVSVGVVNVTFLMENSPQSEIASEKLKYKFSPQEKKLAAELDEINALERELNEIKLANKSIKIQRQKERELRTIKRARSRALQDFREELRFARDLALDEVQKEVFKAIAEVREKHNIDIVLQDYVSASKKVDITPAVLEHLKNKISESKDTNEEQQTKE